MVVTHHPLYRNPIKKMRTPAWRIGKTMSKLREAGVDVYISGHLHRTSFRRTDALVVQAGTVSERLRGEQPSFNLLILNCPLLTVETYRWNAAEKVFKPGRANGLLIKNKPSAKPHPEQPQKEVFVQAPIEPTPVEQPSVQAKAPVRRKRITKRTTAKALS
jgi:hypothetical protein